MAEVITGYMNGHYQSYLVLAGFFMVAQLTLSLTGRDVEPVGRFGYATVNLFVVGAVFGVAPLFFYLTAKISVDLAIAVWLATVTSAMTALAHFARRRSMDAFGETWMAFIAIVPVFCLVLLLKRPNDKSRMGNGSRVALIASSVALAVNVASVSAMVVPSAVLRDGVLPRLDLVDLSIENALRHHAEMINIVLDQRERDGEESYIVGSRVEGRDLIIEIRLPESIAEASEELLVENFGSFAREESCGDSDYQIFMKHGAAIVFEYFAYTSGGGRRELRFRNEKADCE